MGKRILVILGIILGVSSVKATELRYYDYDGTIWKPQKLNKKSPGIFGTKILLFKITERPNLLLPYPEGPDVIEVSVNDVRHKLTHINEITDKEELLTSPADGRIGSLEKVNLENGMEVIPGYYRIIFPDSFKNFRDVEGRNILLDDFKLSEELEKKGLGTFRGPYWNDMVYLLSQPNTAEQFGIITSRGHSREHWDEYFSYLQEKGYIKYKPNLKNIHSISLPEYHVYGLDNYDTAKRKVGLLSEIITRLSNLSVTDKDYRMHPDGNKAGLYHVVSFTEDNQETLDLAVRALRGLATGKFPIKIILSNAGDDYQIKKSKRPKHIVIGKNAVLRAATMSEVPVLYMNEMNRATHLGENTYQCAGLFR